LFLAISKGGKQLLEAEKLLEGVQSAIDAEKRIEAAIKALKDGDSNGSISQAEEAKKVIGCNNFVMWYLFMKNRYF
jgi:hypothetical protein